MLISAWGPHKPIRGCGYEVNRNSQSLDPSRFVGLGWLHAVSLALAHLPSGPDTDTSSFLPPRTPCTQCYFTYTCPQAYIASQTGQGVFANAGPLDSHFGARMAALGEAVRRAHIEVAAIHEFMQLGGGASKVLTGCDLLYEVLKPLLPEAKFRPTDGRFSSMVLYDPNLRAPVSVGGCCCSCEGHCSCFEGVAVITALCHIFTSAAVGTARCSINLSGAAGSICVKVQGLLPNLGRASTRPSILLAGPSQLPPHGPLTPHKLINHLPVL